MKDLELKLHPLLYSDTKKELLLNNIVVTSKDEDNVLIITSEDPRDFFKVGIIYHKILNTYDLRNSG